MYRSKRSTATEPKPDSSRLPYKTIPFDPTAITFTDLNLDQRLLQGIRDLGWKETRPVQSGVIPLAMSGRDVIACHFRYSIR